MAEDVVFMAVERIASLVIQEAVFLRGVRDEIQRLQAELGLMKAFLKDADRRQHQDNRVREWVAGIRDIAYEAEDVIDTFLLEVASDTGEGVRGFVKRVFFKVTKVSLFHKTGTKITSIREKIRSIYENMQNFGINKLAEGESSYYGTEQQQLSRRTYPHAEEEHTINLDDVISQLKAKLMTEEKQVRVVSIVGMGGLGKTTLANNVYNHIEVRQQFDCFSWTFISKQFSAREVLVGILMDVMSSEDESKLETMEKEKPVKSKLKEMKEKMELFETMTENDLIKILRNVLEDKRYLVVLDDIWTNEAWHRLRPAFPNGVSGSKVLFTTRNSGVAYYADRWSSPVELRPLTNDEGWQLLSRKAFPKNVLDEGGCPGAYEELGREMVRKCEGLPLAIMVLGGLLAGKTLREWEKVQRNINALFIRQEQDHQFEGVYEILALSYDDLPFYLKPCFLYLSQFPENTEFHKRTLIRMWIAEGFVSQQSKGKDETIEDVAEQYCNELVNRCMVQVSQRDHTGKGVKTCHLHDVVRQMCISKAMDENYLVVLEHREDSTADSSSSSSSTPHLPTSKSRRIAIHPQISRHEQNEMEFYTPRSKIGLQNLRSLIFFVGDANYRMPKEQAAFIFKNFRLLRVLKLDGVRQQHRLPEEIHNLIHLTYLGLRNTGLKDGKKDFSLPASIGNLRNLYTLDLRNNGYFTRLPDVLWKLTRLRHLLVDDDRDYEHLRLHKLRQLETLKSVYAKNLIREGAMQKLDNLRNIGIYFQKTEEVGAILNSSIISDRLRSLKMRIIGSFSNLEPLSRCRQLTKAELGGAIQEYQPPLRHNLGNLPPNLVKLILWGSELKQDPMCILEKLQHLRFLSLENNVYEGSKMVCSATGFPQLETLTLKSFGLEQWEIEKGAMPCLKSLSLSLGKLKMIPEGLRFLTSVRELKLIHMVRCEERVRVVNGVEGEDFDKVRHIPFISFN
ncbi:hypothetical protein P3X46_014299 [Hevea brasiliensis]|uniref:Uncharacterized protein n=1 Tax=Hevea brasiliensis TaxID=3981 RepID=A0ABQ9M805_HEVBR|nr:putative disease resistance protein At1g50180 [Hevea brasiliensis]KAJ9175783.1 hypothetical protein P3X46_014299 [Hevea brasiliensis]